MPSRLPRWAVLLVVAGTLAQGLFACWLHSLYYARHAPFFDSMAYTNMLASVLTESKEHGIAAGLSSAFGESTVSLPWLIAALLAPLVPISRLTGVWIQTFWMALLGISLVIYWQRYRRAPLLYALLWTFPPLSFSAIYRANGGLSDFRMDLSLYLLFALVIIWYLATRETPSPTPWLLSGLFIGLCFMNRATAPATLGFTLAPVLAARLWLEPDTRSWLLKRIAIYWIPPALIGLLPIIKNWTHIHYYYFVWGAAPTAHLPLTKSVIHIAAAGLNMGIAVAAASALLLALQFGGRASNWRATDWPLVWIACAPALLLVLLGAGPNPFTAMPMVFGCLLFCIAPFSGPMTAERSTKWATALLVLVCAFQPIAGYADHISDRNGEAPSMAALKQGIERMRAESERRGLHHAEFTTAHLADYQATALRNILIYEFGATIHGNSMTLPSGLTLATTYEAPFSPAVPVAWNELPGHSDEERFAYLATQANQHVNFLFLPDEASIGWMERTLPYNYINLKIRLLRRDLLGSGAWTRIGPPISISKNETVELYFNTHLH